MRILVVNDDGISAPGIFALAEAAARFGEVWVVAPEHQCSCMSQHLTIFKDMALKEADFPVPVRAAWSLGGTPADCVKTALAGILDFRPDYVFSGVNDGWNTGFDIAYSGTIGACFEAVMNGVPAMAFSAAGKDDLTAAAEHMPRIMEELLARPLPAGELWNVNFPAHAPKGILRERTIAPMQLYSGFYRLGTHPAGHKILTESAVPIGPGLAPAGSDVAAVLDGYISIGKIRSPLM